MTNASLIGGCLGAPGNHFKGYPGKLIRDHGAFLFFGGVKRRKPRFGGHSRVKWQRLPALASQVWLGAEEVVLPVNWRALGLSRSHVS